MIYYLIISVLSLFSLFKQVNHKTRNIKLLTIISFVFLVMVGGFRYQVGADWESYERLFFSLVNWSDVIVAREEILFTTFMYSIKNLFNNYSVFVFILFVVSFSLKYNIIKCYSPDIFLSLMVYLYTLFLIYDINGLRQGLSIGIVLQGIPFILNRKLCNFLILIIIASLCHISALLFLPLYYLAKMQISNKILLLSFIPVMGVSFQVGNILQFSSAFQNFLAIEKFVHYSVYTTDVYKNSSDFILNIALFQRLFIFALFMFYYKQIKIKDDLKLLLRNGYFISIIIFVMFSFSSEFSARLGFYYKSLELIIIPLIVSCPSKCCDRIILLSIFIIFCLVGTYRLLSLTDGNLLPYDNILLLNIV